MKVEGTKWYWSRGSQILEGTRPTGPIGWMRLCVAVWFQTDERFAGIPYRAYRLTSSHDFLRVSYGHQRFLVSYWRRWSIRLLTWLWCLSMSHLSKRTGYPSSPLPLLLPPSPFPSPISLPPNSPPIWIMNVVCQSAYPQRRPNVYIRCISLIRVRLKNLKISFDMSSY